MVSQAAHARAPVACIVLASRDTRAEGHQPQGIRGRSAEQEAWGYVGTAPCISLALLHCRAAVALPYDLLSTSSGL